MQLVWASLQTWTFSVCYFTHLFPALSASLLISCELFICVGLEANPLSCPTRCFTLKRDLFSKINRTHGTAREIFTMTWSDWNKVKSVGSFYEFPPSHSPTPDKQNHINMIMISSAGTVCALCQHTHHITVALHYTVLPSDRYKPTLPQEFLQLFHSEDNKSIQVIRCISSFLKQRQKANSKKRDLWQFLTFLIFFSSRR